jgi:HK97 family phage prohead protease
MDARFPNGQEKRFLAVEAEVRGHADGRRLSGYAAVFDRVAKLGDFTEVVKPGAFRSTLASGADVLALADHDMTRVLGRTKAGTLKLAEDSRGLHFEIDALPATGYADDLLALVRSGNIGGASFAFSVNKPGGDHWEGRSRELRSVTLFEISCISGVPAYRDTVVQARSMPDGSVALLRRLSLAMS